jgi:hypothetical protein
MVCARPDESDGPDETLGKVQNAKSGFLQGGIPLPPLQRRRPRQQFRTRTDVPDHLFSDRPSRISAARAGSARAGPQFGRCTETAFRLLWLPGHLRRDEKIRNCFVPASNLRGAQSFAGLIRHLHIETPRYTSAGWWHCPTGHKAAGFTGSCCPPAAIRGVRRVTKQ